MENFIKLETVLIFALIIPIFTLFLFSCNRGSGHERFL